jgi:hypothetical protein
VLERGFQSVEGAKERRKGRHAMLGEIIIGLKIHLQADYKDIIAGTRKEEARLVTRRLNKEQNGGAERLVSEVQSACHPA